MSAQHPHKVLVMGGIRSGKSEFAESLAEQPSAGESAAVRYVATAAVPDGDHEWAERIDAHRNRRPAHWTTEDIGAAPDRLAAMIKNAGNHDTVLIDDLGGWFTAMLPPDDGDPDAAEVDIEAVIADLVAAVESSAARVILVSPEVGLSLVAPTPIGRWFADAVGTANRALARIVDDVVLVVAGRPMWLPAAERPTLVDAPTPPAGARARRRGRPSTTPAMDDVADAVTVTRYDRPPVPSAVAIFAAAADDRADAPDHDAAGEADVHVGMPIPMPDTDAVTAAEARIAQLPVAGPGIGGLAAFAKFAAGAQGDASPRPFQSVRVIAICGAHDGAVGTGGVVPGWAQPDTADHSALARLAAAAGGVTIELIDAGVGRPIEQGDVMDEAELATALRRGWRRGQAAADRGDDLVVLAAGGPGVDAAAAAVLAAITRAEVPSLLPRVYGTDGLIDDDAWMVRCVAIRDAVTRLGPGLHDGTTSLGAVGGPSIATATGVVLGAAQRGTPVLIDGPVGAAAALAARDYAAEVRLWCAMTDVAGDPAVGAVADRMGLEPMVSVGFGLGEGANALALLPMFQSALTAAALAGSDVANDADSAAGDHNATA
ncbi:MAG TPA: bifunctional adenosylcobinamide kinase/adenosylcobinamide-phosphate guanylyltransferase [Micromonosporaceae bacterium]|nr:bifunctional adenosylcobinamide kinase/adenosylcobinamide-phosphate guanylyltransferase [Micromonosporaceae bacterium]